MSNTNIIAKNILRSTQVRGNFSCIYNSVDDIQPSCFLHGDLYLGREVENGDGTYTNTGGDIVIRIKNNEFIITPTILSYLVNITSDIQSQIQSNTSDLTEKLDITTFNTLQTAFNLLQTEIPLTYVLKSIYDIYIAGNDTNISNLQSSVSLVQNALTNYLLNSTYQSYITTNDTNILNLQNGLTSINSTFSNYLLQSVYSSYITTNDTNILNLQNSFSNYLLQSVYNTFLLDNTTTINSITSNINDLDSRVTNIELNGTTSDTSSSSVLDSYITYNSTNDDLTITKSINFNKDILFSVLNEQPIPPTSELRAIRNYGSSSTVIAGGLTSDIDLTAFNFSISFHIKILNTSESGTAILRGPYINVSFKKVNELNYISVVLKHPSTNVNTSHDYEVNINEWFLFTYTQEYINFNVWPNLNVKVYINTTLGINLSNVQNKFIPSLIIGPILQSYADILITEIMVFNKLLDITEIGNIRVNQLQLPITNQTNLILYYRFDSEDLTQIDKSPGAPNNSLLLNSNIDFVYDDLPTYLTYYEPIPESVINSSEGKIKFTYQNYDFELTSKTLFHLRNLQFDVQDSLSIISQNSLSISENSYKLQHITGGGNDTFIEKHLSFVGDNSGLILGAYGDYQFISFSRNCFINQFGNNVTNYFKTISIADNCFLNEIPSEKLRFLSTITSNVQTQLNDANVNINNTASNVNIILTDITTINNNINELTTDNVVINSKINTIESIFGYTFTPSYITEWLFVELNSNITINHNMNYNETNNISNFKIVFKPTFNSTLIMEVSPSSNGNEGFLVRCDSNAMRIKCGTTLLSASILDTFDVYTHQVGFIKIYFFKSLFGINII